MKTRELLIFLIVLLILLIVGLVVFLVFCLSGKPRWMNWKGRKSSQIIFDTSYVLAEVEKIELLSSVGDVSFKESMDGQIRVMVYGENEEDLKVDFVENQLKIDYMRDKRKSLFFNFNLDKNDMVIYLPKEFAKQIDMRVNYGDIQGSNLENASIRIEEDCGDVSLGKVKNAFVKNNYGDIRIEEVNNKMEIESDCGDVKIGTIMLLEDSSIINNFGDIKIGKTNEIYMDAKTDLGDVKINHNYRHSETILKIENNCGNIKVEN